MVDVEIWYGDGPVAIKLDALRYGKNADVTDAARFAKEAFRQLTKAARQATNTQDKFCWSAKHIEFI